MKTLAIWGALQKKWNYKKLQIKKKNCQQQGAVKNDNDIEKGDKVGAKISKSSREWIWVSSISEKSIMISSP